MTRRLRLICPDCQGRQVRWMGRALVPCTSCDEKGYIFVPSLMAEGFVGIGLFVGFALLVALVPS